MQKGDITTYHKLIDKDNAFCSEKVNVNDMHILSIQETSGSSTDTIDNLESGSITAAFKAVSGATRYHIIPIRCNYGYFSAVSYSGTKITATAINASGEPHTLAATFLVIAYRD